MSQRFVRWGLVLGCALVVAGPGTDVIARSRYDLRRAPLQKPQETQVYSGLITSSLMVKFTDDLGVYAQAGRLYHSDGRPVVEVNRLIDQGVAASAEPEFEQDKATLLDWRRQGEARAQTPLVDLTQYFRRRSRVTSLRERRTSNLSSFISPQHPSVSTPTPRGPIPAARAKA